MQIVIDISENIYTDCLTSGYAKHPKEVLFVVVDAIRKGIVLPKGHGRLIDADKLETDIEEYEEEWTWYGSRHGYSCEQVDNAQTIIEADEVEE